MKTNINKNERCCSIVFIFQPMHKWQFFTILLCILSNRQHYQEIEISEHERNVSTSPHSPLQVPQSLPIIGTKLYIILFILSSYHFYKSTGECNAHTPNKEASVLHLFWTCPCHLSPKNWGNVFSQKRKGESLPIILFSPDGSSVKADSGSSKQFWSGSLVTSLLWHKRNSMNTCIKLSIILILLTL